MLTLLGILMSMLVLLIAADAVEMDEKNRTAKHVKLQRVYEPNHPYYVLLQLRCHKKS
jgi:hypothetical protein